MVRLRLAIMQAKLLPSCITRMLAKFVFPFCDRRLGTADVSTPVAAATFAQDDSAFGVAERVPVRDRGVGWAIAEVSSEPGHEPRSSHARNGKGFARVRIGVTHPKPCLTRLLANDHRV